MPNRFEYIQSNLKSNAQQKTQSGICKRPETPVPLSNNWTQIGTVVAGALPLRVWKDAAGTVHLAGCVIIGASVPAGTSGNYPIGTLAPEFRPANLSYTVGSYYDGSATNPHIAVPCSVDGNGLLSMTLATGAATPATGDFLIISAAWNAA